MAFTSRIFSFVCLGVLLVTGLSQVSADAKTETAAADGNAEQASAASSTPRETEERLASHLAIDQWLQDNGNTLNKYGDSVDTMYAGGSPLFDEKTGTTIDLYDYIQKKHPSAPWNSAESKGEDIVNSETREGSTATNTANSEPETTEEVDQAAQSAAGLKSTESTPKDSKETVAPSVDAAEAEKQDSDDAETEKNRDSDEAEVDKKQDSDGATDDARRAATTDAHKDSVPTESSSDTLSMGEKEEEKEEESSMGTTVMLGALGAAVAVGAGFFAINGSGETKRAKGSAVLIVGPSNAGKTQLFLTLKDGQVCNDTVTSMQENEGTFTLGKFDEDSATPLHVIDYPGDPSLSFRLPDFYPVAKVVVFMIDATDKKSIEREAAEMMYRILTNPGVVDQSPTILVACNKCDRPPMLVAKPPVLKKLFETELQKLSRTQGVGEDSLTDEGDTKESIPLGVDGQDFEFEKHSPCPVEFVKCSVAKADLQALVERIRDCADM